VQMEALLQIIEATEKNRLLAEQCDGVYHLNVAKEEGYARSGVNFFAHDDVHSYVMANGDIPAFPELEDVPQNQRVSFDVFYFLVPSNARLVHRITITRAHGPERAFVKACFVDGNLIYLSGAGRGELKVYLFNSKEWNSGATSKGNLPHFWFHVDKQRVDIVADAYFSITKMLWMKISPKAPSHYGIFVNDHSTLNGNTTLAQHEQQNEHYWTSVLSLTLLLPFWILWMLLISFFVLPVQLCLGRCEVRRYWVRAEREGGESRHSEVIMEPSETTRLLG